MNGEKLLNQERREKTNRAAVSRSVRSLDRLLVQPFSVASRSPSRPPRPPPLPPKSILTHDTPRIPILLRSRASRLDPGSPICLSSRRSCWQIQKPAKRMLLFFFHPLRQQPPSRLRGCPACLSCPPRPSFPFFSFSWYAHSFSHAPLPFAFPIDADPPFASLPAEALPARR